MKTKRQFQPNDRDRRLILDCYRFRYLTEDLLHVLHREEPAPGRKYGFSKWGLAARLKKLAAEGYLKRYYFTDLRTDEPYRKQAAIYGIGERALDFIVSFAGADRELLQEQVARRVGSPFLRHTLGLNRLHIGLEAGIAASGEEVRLLAWYEGTRRLKHTFYREKRDRTTGEASKEFYMLVPDAFFVLQKGEAAPRHYFVEYDRGTESAAKKFRQKLSLYLWYAEKRLFAQKYFYVHPGKIEVLADMKWSELSAADRKLVSDNAIPGFSVLVLCAATEADYRKMREGKEASRFRETLLLNETKKFAVSGARRIRDPKKMAGYTSQIEKLFAFATEVNLGDPLAEPSAVLAPVWRHIRSGRGPVSLI